MSRYLLRIELQINDQATTTNSESNPRIFQRYNRSHREKAQSRYRSETHNPSHPRRHVINFVQDPRRDRGGAAARGAVLVAPDDVAGSAGAGGTGWGAEEAWARTAGRRSARQEAGRVSARDQPVAEARRAS